MAKKIDGLKAVDLFHKVLQKEFPSVSIHREYRFHKTRMWRFDYAIPDLKIAIEVDGGIWKNGRHNRPVGYINDLDKFNTAATMGWLVLKVIPDGKFTNKCLNYIDSAIKYRENERVGAESDMP